MIINPVLLKASEEYITNPDSSFAIRIQLKGYILEEKRGDYTRSCNCSTDSNEYEL